MRGWPEWDRRRFVSSGVALAAGWQLRRAARALGATGTARVCTLAAEQEVGPYYVKDEQLRSGIAEGRAGLPLSLELTVMDARNCTPLIGAAVDLWHCDALGLYSGYTAMNPRGMGPGGPPPGSRGPAGGDGQGPPPGFDPEHPGNRPGPREGFGPPPENHPTDKMTFLRGVQMTDAAGVVRFETIFPGFYMGRTNHIHFKVREGGHPGEGSGKRTYLAGHTAHTGQVFFPEELTVTLMEREPYRGHTIHRTTQREDGVFNGQHGALSIAQVSFAEPGKPESGMRAHLITAVDPTATPAPARRSGPGGPPPGRGEERSKVAATE